MRKPRQPDPDVHESDYRVPTALGSIAWTLALAVLLLMGDRLPASERWWIWVCVTGLALGIFGYLYIPRVLRSRQRAEERHTAGHDPGEQGEQGKRDEQDRQGG